MDLSADDLRLLGVDCDIAQYLDKKPEAWSCLNVTLKREELDNMSLACFEAAMGLIIAVCRLRLDEARCVACGKLLTTEHGGQWCPCPECKQPFEPGHECKAGDVPEGELPI